MSKFALPERSASTSWSRNKGTPCSISASLGGGMDLVATLARQRAMISSRCTLMNSCSMEPNRSFGRVPGGLFEGDASSTRIADLAGCGQYTVWEQLWLSPPPSAEAEQGEPES